MSGAVVSGFIPVKSGDVIRVYGTDSGAAGKDGIWDQSGNKVLWTVDTSLFATMPVYICVSMNFCAGADFIITVNQEIL